MTRNTSRTTTFSIAAALFCLLLAATSARAQSALQPPAQSDSQPSAQDNAPPAPSGQDDPLHTASRTELDVVKVVVAQEKAWNAGDIAGFVKAYKDSPDTILIGKQVSRGFQQILDDYQHNFTTRASMGDLTYSELQVTALSDTYAICTGKYHVDRARKDGGSAEGLFSLVLEKTGQGWKIVLDHTT